MVVVSGNWIKNEPPWPASFNRDLAVETNENMAAKAILICRPNSDRFEDRTLTLDQQIKVGRAVARAKPTESNAIFDCKVLSRHHALLWYEDGKFYLQDTKSSNGTFVNNNRLSADRHEISSGDIVQFGVDVVENNRKVTHGCIIATLKLYLPDGKEAKASPSITEADSHSVVPLDELYKLNQILQEASQREQCLESKLIALQNVVEETKRSAEESWQAYVGEEQLLSRLSALETKLQQAKNNWSEDKLKEEIAKLQEDNERYQEVAKEALEKVHAEKQQAVMMALEQERAKIRAQQDALLATEHLEQTQIELQDVVQRLTEIQTRADEEKREHEKLVRELEQHLDEEGAKIIELEAKIYELRRKHNYEDEIELKRPDKFPFRNMPPLDLTFNEIRLFNESLLKDFKKQNRIDLMVTPIEENSEKGKSEDLECESSTKQDADNEDVQPKEDGKRVSFNLPLESETGEQESQNSPIRSPNQETTEETFADHVDSKTLKYQYQSAQREQKELRRKIEILEKNSETNKTKIAELNKALCEEKELSAQRLIACEKLKQELEVLDGTWQESREENQLLIKKINELVQELEKRKEEIARQQTSTTDEQSPNGECVSESNTTIPLNASLEQLTSIEEELVLFKEKYAEICDEKVKLQRDLLKLRVQYDSMCDNVYNKYFWYVGPLVLVIIYLLLRELIS